MRVTVEQVPDELTEHILRRAGISSTDERTTRLVSLAAQTFLDQVLRQAKDVQKNRSQAPAAHQKAEGVNVRDKRATLLTEDLAKALQEVSVTHAHVCADYQHHAHHLTTHTEAHTPPLPCSLCSMGSV